MTWRSMVLLQWSQVLPPPPSAGVFHLLFPASNFDTPGKAATGPLYRNTLIQGLIALLLSHRSLLRLCLPRKPLASESLATSAITLLHFLLSDVLRAHTRVLHRTWTLE